MVILEAMMAGLPALATKVGGVPDAVKDKGLLVSPADPSGLSAAMYQLIMDKGLASLLGKAGQKHAKTLYGVDRMVDEYVDCYRKMIIQKTV